MQAARQSVQPLGLFAETCRGGQKMYQHGSMSLRRPQRVGMHHAEPDVACWLSGADGVSCSACAGGAFPCAEP